MRMQPLEERHVGIVGGWHWNEWGNRDPFGSLETWTRRIACSLGDDDLPRWYVATEARKAIGSVGLVPHDMSDRPDQRHRTPWVSGVFVDQGYRKQGVASAMMQYISECTLDGTLFLQTYSAESLYASLGWVVIERVMYHDELTSIMSLVKAS